MSLAKRISMYRDSNLFFHQIRIGLGGKPIVITKFRTMRKGAHRHMRPGLAEKTDTRITKIGRILRKTHIDELPQLISVIRGELLPVGSRVLQRQQYMAMPGEIRELYRQVAGVVPLERACRNFPPSTEEYRQTLREFHAMWKKDRKRAYIAFTLRALRNWFKDARTGTPMRR